MTRDQEDNCTGRTREKGTETMRISLPPVDVVCNTFEEPDEIIILNSNFDNKIDLIMMMKDKDRFDHAFLGSSRIPEFLYRGKFLFPT